MFSFSLKLARLDSVGDHDTGFPAGSRSASFQSAISPPNNGPQQPKSDFSTGTMAPGGLRSWLSSQASLVCNGPLAQRKFPVLWTRQRRAPNFSVNVPIGWSPRRYTALTCLSSNLSAREGSL